MFFNRLTMLGFILLESVIGEWLSVLWLYGFSTMSFPEKLPSQC